MIGLLFGMLFELIALMISLTILLIRLLIRGSLMLAAVVVGAIEARRVHRAREIARVPLDPDVRWSVFQRDGYACTHCGSQSDLTIDHVHPVSLGGLNDPTNLQTLCRSCNSRKGVT